MAPTIKMFLFHFLFLPTPSFLLSLPPSFFLAPWFINSEVAMFSGSQCCYNTPTAQVAASSLLTGTPSHNTTWETIYLAYLVPYPLKVVLTGPYLFPYYVSLYSMWDNSFHIALLPPSHFAQHPSCGKLQDFTFFILNTTLLYIYYKRWQFLYPLVVGHLAYSLSSSKHHCNKQRRTKPFQINVFYVFGYLPRSGITGSHGSTI